MTWLTIALVVVTVLAVWLTWTALRIDRLNARCDTAWHSLDAALVRRSAALAAVAADPAEPLDEAARARILELTSCAHVTDRAERAQIENRISATIAKLSGQLAAQSPAAGALREACTRVQIARTFYNDAVRATSALRGQRLPRLTRLGRRVSIPQFFDIDDQPGTVPADERI